MFMSVTDRVLAHPKAVILTIILLTAIFANGMRFMHSDTDVTRDLPQHTEAKRLYDEIEVLFPAKEMVIVGIEDDSLFTADGVARLDRLTKRFEALPGVQSVMSPTNARIIRGVEGGMEVKEAADPLPSNDDEARAFRARLESQPMFKNTLVSTSTDAIAMLVLVKAGVREADVAEKLIEIGNDSSQNEGYALLIGGRPASTYWSKVIMGRDMGMLSSMALLVVILILLITFRSGRGVIFPMGVVVASVIWTLGLMGYLDIPITHSTEVLPILLIAIGVADGIHILKTYYNAAKSQNDPRVVVRNTMADLNRPVILTSITTACGFMALNTSGIDSIMMLGLLTAFGVIAAMLFSLTFIPAALALMKLPAPKAAKDQEIARGRFDALEALAERYANFLVTHKSAVSLGILGVIGLAIFGATLVPVEMSTINNFPEDHPFRVASEKLNRYFGGSTNLVVVVEGKEEGSIKEPAILKKMDELETYLKKQPNVGSVRSITGFIKQMHKVMHGDTEEEYRLPEETEKEKGVEYVEIDGKEVEQEVEFEVPGRDLVAQYLALYEMSGKPDDFANLVTYDFSTAKINVMIDSDRASVLDRIVGGARTFIGDNFGGLKAELTGMAELLRAVNKLVVTGQAWSIATSLLLVLFITSLMFRSSVLGLFATLPLFFSLFLNFGVMGLSGIPLNVMTMATSSVAVGVGIDYAIHFVHRYQFDRLRCRNFEEAVPSAMRSSGVAIILNALTVAAGFFSLALSDFRGVAEMGMLIALTMLTSAFAALTILPMLFVWLKPAAFERAAPRGAGKA